MVTMTTLNNEWAALNIVFGIISKTGGMTYTLAETKTKIDIWIGLDVGRRENKNYGTSSVAFSTQGLFLGWTNVTWEQGEKISDVHLDRNIRNIIDEINLKREKIKKEKIQNVCILRDGFFYENKKILQDIEKDYNINIIAVEIRKSGAFRLATITENKKDLFQSGSNSTFFWFDNIGFVQSTDEQQGFGSPCLFQVQLIHGNEKMNDLLHDF